MKTMIEVAFPLSSPPVMDGFYKLNAGTHIQHWSRYVVGRGFMMTHSDPQGAMKQTRLSWGARDGYYTHWIGLTPEGGPPQN